MKVSADIQKVVRRYRERIARHGVGTQALATGNAARRKLRYGVLAGVGIRKGDSVLDVGCGTGSFRDFLQRTAGPVRYEGMDVVPEFIAHCRSKHKESRFYLTDFLSYKPKRRFDYVVASQVFNNRYRGASNETMVRRVLEKAYAICRRGVAVDFLTSYVDYRERHLFYYDPGLIFKFAKKITKRVALRHDYPLYEFCVYLYKDFEPWRKSP